MNELATLTSPTTLELPKEIATRFQPDDRFYTWLEGDTVLLKRVKKVTLGDMLARVKQVPDDNPPTLEEINEIVHEVRRQYRE